MRKENKVFIGFLDAIIDSIKETKEKASKVDRRELKSLFDDMFKNLDEDVDSPLGKKWVQLERVLRKLEKNK